MDGINRGLPWECVGLPIIAVSANIHKDNAGQLAVGEDEAKVVRLINYLYRGMANKATY